MTATSKNEVSALAVSSAQISALSAMDIATLAPEVYAAEVYKPFKDQLAGLIDACRLADYDITTTAGMKSALALRAPLRDLRVAADKERKARKAPLLTIGKLLESNYDQVEERILPLELLFDAEIKAEEARKEEIAQAKKKAEAERVVAILADIQAITNLPMLNASASAADVLLAVGELEAIEPTKERFGDYDGQAAAAIVGAMDALRTMHAEKVASEAAAAQAELDRQAEAARVAAQQAENERQRLENERIANEQAAERKRLADIAAAQEAALRQQREQAEANLRAAAEAHTREVERARQEQERVAAENKRQMEAQQAAIAAERKALEDAKAEKARTDALAAQVEADHAEALVQDAEYNAERSRLQAASEQLLADARAAAPLAAVLADASLTDSADQLLAEELWPEDGELVAEIRAMFRREWGMDEQQADARMSRFDFAAALAEMAVPA